MRTCGPSLDLRNGQRGTLLNKRLGIAVFAGSLGGFVFGYDLGALSAATQSLRGQFQLSSWLFGLTISSSIWGTVVGSILAGRFADRLDRRKLIALSAVIYMCASIAITLPVPSEWLFVLTMRFLCGIAIGGFTVGCPLYLSEIAPARMRGRVVGLFQVQVGAGVIAAFSVGAIVAHLVEVNTAWKWVLGFGALPAMILLLTLRFMPQVEAQSSDDRHSNPPELSSSVHAEQSNRQRLFQSKNMRLILVATSIAVFNQLSGVNILLLYMLEIFASAGMSFSLGHRYTVLISCLGMLTTLAGMAFIDRWGRKALLYVGSAGMSVCMFMLGQTIPQHRVPLLYVAIFVAYNAFFAFSQGTVVWVYLSELFPPGLRGRGQGYGATVHWVANALLISIFPRVQHASTVRIFYVFALMMIVQIVVIWRWYPETKGVALGSFVSTNEPHQDRLR